MEETNKTINGSQAILSKYFTLDITNFDTFGAFLRYKRKEMGLTQEKLAEIIGTLDTHVSKWETNRAFPEDEYQTKLSNVIKVSKSDFKLFDKKTGELLEKPRTTGGDFGEFNTEYGKQLAEKIMQFHSARGEGNGDNPLDSILLAFRDQVKSHKANAEAQLDSFRSMERILDALIQKKMNS